MKTFWLVLSVNEVCSLRLNNLKILLNKQVNKSDKTTLVILVLSYIVTFEDLCKKSSDWWIRNFQLSCDSSRVTKGFLLYLLLASDDVTFENGIGTLNTCNLLKRKNERKKFKHSFNVIIINPQPTFFSSLFPFNKGQVFLFQ